VRVIVLKAPLVRVGAATENDERVDGAILHFELRLEPEGWIAHALAPIAIGGVALEPGSRRRVLAGDRVTVGSEELELAEPVDDSQLPTRELALREADRLVRERRGPVPALVVVEGPSAGARLELELDAKTYRVGRGHEVALRLEDDDVSREHVGVARNGATVHVWDLGSKAGVFLGPRRLAPDVRVVWPPTIMLRVGRSVLRVLAPAPEERSSKPADAAPVAPPAPPSTRGDAPMVTPPAGSAPIAHAKEPRANVFVIAAIVAVIAASIMALIWVFKS